MLPDETEELLQAVEDYGEAVIYAPSYDDKVDAEANLKEWIHGNVSL